MKVGRHAQETLADIVARKQKEIEEEGFTFWGYGGPTCHPSSAVQPFAKAAAQASRPIHLVMQEMESKHEKTPVCSAEFSLDRQVWKPIPKGIQVLGSNYALAIRDLRLSDEALLLNQSRVAVGPSKDRPGHLYIGGHVDKACLEVTAEPLKTNRPEKYEKPIGLVAELLDPYAVFLRGERG
jgi:hypothetical protein